MKKVIIVIVFFILISARVGLPVDDNTYGDYLLAGISKTISLDLEKANLIDVLKMLSQQTGLNFVSTEVVRDRTLTLYMEEVPIKEAMDIIFKANSLAYDYHPVANIFVVKETGKPTIELRNKVYYLRYARIESSKMEGEIASVLKVEGGKGGIKGAVEGVLTEFGKVNVDALTNSLIVVDIPSNFSIIDQLIEKLDIPPSKVMIEVEMLDVSKRLIDQVGFKWGEGYGLYGRYALPTRTSNFPFTGKLRSATKPSTTIGTLDFNSYELIMQFLAKDTTTKFLARPKILTLSNETAEVKIEMDEVVGITTTTSGETASTSQTAERADTGTKLRVTPQVNLATKEITLFVEIWNKESKDSGLAMSGLTGGNVKNIEERGTKSVVRLKDGELLLIGGLIKNTDETSVFKVPFLGDIPIVGRFFRFTDSDKIERELLVFLTPHIIEDTPAVAKKEVNLLREQTKDSLKKRAVKIALDKVSKDF